MRLSRKDRADADIDVGSFSDIAFLLIIFFILTCTFLRPAGEEVRVPSGKSDPEQDSSEKQPTVNVNADGILWNGEVAMDLERLQEKPNSLKLHQADKDKRSVILDCADEVSYQTYFDVCMAITKAGGVVALMEHDEGGGGEGP